MKPRYRGSPRASRAQGPQRDEADSPAHTCAEPWACASRDGSRLQIDLARICEAERRREEGLGEIQARVWRRIQDARCPAPAATTAHLVSSIAREDLSYIVRQVAHFGVPRADIEDVAQEVLAAVYRWANQHDATRGNRRTWLYIVAFHHSMNHLGRAYHRHEVPTPPDTFNDAAGSTAEKHGPEAGVIAREDRRLVWESIAKIEVHRRAVFIAYEVLEKPMDEIVRTLGIPESTGWGQLQQARKDFVLALRKLRLREAFPGTKRRRS